MQLRTREFYRADCGCDGGALREHEETVQERAIINEFLAAPDAVSMLAKILRELAEASSAEAQKELEQLYHLENADRGG